MEQRAISNQRSAVGTRIGRCGVLPPVRGNGRADSRGFTILLAALVASLVLALGISVFTIAQKQLVLSSIGRNSQYAFYTADTAAECALYWDMRHPGSDVSAFDPSTPMTPLECDADTIDVTTIACGGGSCIARFEFEFEPNGYCANVTVEKNSTHPRTVIHADGFSVPCDDVQESSRVLQRSVELTY